MTTLYPVWSGPAVQPAGAARRPSRRGAAAVEFALVMPLFGLLIVGMLEAGRGTMVRHVLSEAAVKACRTGALPGTDNAEIVSAAHSVLEGNRFPTDQVKTTVLVNGHSGDAGLARRNDRITVVVSIPTAQVYWSTGGFMRRAEISSEPIVMMRQG